MQSGDLPLHEQSNPCLHGIIMDLKTMMMMMMMQLCMSVCVEGGQIIIEIKFFIFKIEVPFSHFGKQGTQRNHVTTEKNCFLDFYLVI